MAQLLYSYAGAYADIAIFERETQDIKLTNEQKQELRKLYENFEKATKEILNYCGYEYEIDNDFYIN